MDKKPIFDLLSNHLDNLKEGEYITVSKENGEVFVSGRKQLRNTTFISAGMQPVRANWFALSPSTGKKKYFEFGKESKYKENARKSKSEKVKDLAKAGILMNLMFMNLEDGTPVKTAFSSYFRFNIGSFLVFTNNNMNPIWYQNGDAGDKIYI